MDAGAAAAEAASGGGQQQGQRVELPAGLAEQLYAELRRAVKAANNGTDTATSSEGFWDNLQGFLHAIDWQERWIQGLLAAQLALFVLVIACRRNTSVLGGVFVLLGALIYFGERINSLAAQHWDAFATQNYFDEHGVFYNALVSAPALVTLFAVLIFYLREAATLMVQVKAKEIKHKARLRAKAERESKKDQ